MARQPIYDRELEVYGYELLFRAQAGVAAADVDPDAATSRTIVAALSDIGLDAIVGDRLGFINATARFVLDDFALLFPPRRVGFELLEDVPVTPELTEKLRELAGQGYVLSLDDFVETEDRRPLLEFVHLVKVDVLTLAPDELAEQVRRLRASRVKLLAEKVEDHATFQLCHELGFEYFQGFFLCRPRTLTGEAIPTAKLSRLRLLAALHDPAMTLDQLEALLRGDVGLSYRLLRLINSSFFFLPNRVRSIREALVLLGQTRVRNWTAVLGLAEMQGVPSELTRIALVRARMCERLAEAARRPDSSSCFIVGLFSALDAMLDAPLERILRDLPLDESVSAALLDRSGPCGPLLATVLAYEQGQFDELALREEGDVLSGHYLEALVWVDEATRPVAPPASRQARR